MVTPKDCRCILNRIKNVHSYTMSENSSSSTVVDEISSVNSSTSAATFENRGLSTPSTSATRKGGVKRVLTPSPELFYKKSLQIAGDMAAENKGEDIGMEVGPGSSFVSVPLPLDADDVAAHLKDVMLPEIQNMIQQQIVVEQAASIAEIVDKAIGKAVKSINDTLMKEINAVKTESDKLRSENSDLRKSVDKLTQRVDKLELLTDEGEQYQRRNSIRISSIPETKDENTDAIVSKLASDLGVHLHPSDIDRSHRSGRVVGKRSILAKFASYNARHAVYSKRMDLRETDNWSNTFINENLTARRSKILFTARRYVREKLLSSSYSTDGRIYVKDGDGKKTFDNQS